MDLLQWQGLFNEQTNCRVAVVGESQQLQRGVHTLIPSVSVVGEKGRMVSNLVRCGSHRLSTQTAGVTPATPRAPSVLNLLLCNKIFLGGAAVLNANRHDLGHLLAMQYVD